MHKDFSPIVAGSVLSAVASAAATLWFVQWRESRNLDRSAKSAKVEGAGGHRSKNGGVAQEIIDEQQARTRAFLKPEGMAKLSAATVAVVGAGGVGSWVATMLVRSGVGRVIIIDFDQVSLSSLNRHACATLEDVGTSKVECLADYLRRVAPWIDVVPKNALWDAEQGPQLLEGADYVVDCIDNIETKVALLAHCVKSKVPVVSSMGAGAKGDPTRIAIADISQTFEDPLSSSVRVLLRTRHGIHGGIPVAFSTEKPGKDKAKLLDLDESHLEEGNVEELSVLRNFRVRILPVLGPLPALFGLTLATHLLCVIGGYNAVFDTQQGGYSLAAKSRPKLYESMLSSINGQFMRLKLDDRTTHVSRDEVEYLIEEVWRGKTIGGEFTRQRLTLWDPKGPYTIHNMVPVNRDEQERHEQLIFREGRPLSEVYSPEQIEEVRRRFALDRWYQNFRVN